MNFRNLRENWDAAFLLIFLFLIFCWSVFVACLTLFGQTEPRAIVTWDRIPDARLASYKLLRGLTAASLQPVSATTDTSSVDITIDPNTKYYYAVRGVDNAGIEGDIGLASNNPFRFSDIQPASPTSLICTPTRQGSTATIACSWGIVTKTRSLLVLPTGSVVTYRGFLANTGTLQTFTILNGQSVTISGLRKNQTFYFYCTAVLNGIESLGSPAVRVQS